MKNSDHIVKVVIAVFISFHFITTNGQIPNSSFEEWEEVTYTGPSGTFTYEKPLGWATNQNAGVERLQKSTDSQDGLFSLKLFNSVVGAINDCPSRVITSVDFSNPIEPNKSLFFYYKSISNNNDGNVYFKVDITFYQNGEVTDQENWTNNIEIPDYTLVEIPLTQDSDSIFIKISGGAAGGPNDLCYLESTIWIDHLSIGDSILSIEDNVLAENITLFPNPVDDVLYIHNKSGISLKKMIIFDNLGNLLLEQNTNVDQINVANLANGLFFVIIETQEGEFIKKVVKK